MKIGMFTDTYNPQINGVVRTIQTWKESLEERGHDVVVVHPDSNDVAPGDYALPASDLPFYEGYQVAAVGREIPDELKDLDVVHAHTQFSVGAYGAYLASKLEIPRIVTYHTPVEEYAHYASLGVFEKSSVKLYMTWEKKFMENAATVTAPTELIAASLSERIERDVEVLSNGVDVKRFVRGGGDEFREKHGFDGTLVGFCGRHSSEKRLGDLIKLAEIMDVTVVIGGDGPVREEYEEMASGIDNVTFLGIIPEEDMPAFYSALDCFVLPSVAETQGLVVLEANACGVPAVGADAMALKETIEEGVNGLLYEPGDISGLHDAVERVLEDDSLCESAVTHAHQHSVARTIDSLEGLYESANYTEGGIRTRSLYKIPMALSYMFHKIYS